MVWKSWLYSLQIERFLQIDICEIDSVKKTESK